MVGEGAGCVHSIKGVEQKRGDVSVVVGCRQLWLFNLTGLLLPMFLCCVAECCVAPQVVGHG